MVVEEEEEEEVWPERAKVRIARAADEEGGK